MKTYPSIVASGLAEKGQDCYVFVKYDGSNLRFEWTKKKGWWKFGTRKRLFDTTDPIFGTAIALFEEKYADPLVQIFATDKGLRGVTEFTVFCEWYGHNSFADFHSQEDEKTLVLIDVNPLKKGILGPKQFLDTFGHLPDAAELLERAVFDQELIDRIRSGELSCQSKHWIANKTPEGAVCKGGTSHRLWMAKVKTQDYLDKLKEERPKNWAEFWE